MKNMEVEIEEKGKIWRNKPLTEFKPEKIEYVGKKKTPTAEVQVEDVKKPEIPEHGSDFSRVTLLYPRLKELLNLFGTVVTEAKFKIGQDGMTCTAVDPAHVGMITVNMPKDTFTEFRCDGESTWALDIENFNKTLPKGKPKDVITLSGSTEHLTVEIGAFKREYTLLDPNTVTKPRIPEIDPEFSFTMGQYEIKNALLTAEPVSDSIRLTLNSDGVVFYAMSDSEKSEANFTKDMIKEIVTPGGVQVKSSYPLEYLVKLFKAMKTVDEAKIRFKDDYPMVVEFNAKGSNRVSEVVSYEFLLAPRMEQ